MSVLALVSVFAFSHLSGAQPDRFLVDTGCDLQTSPCTATAEGGRSIRFAIAPEGIPLLEPLAVSVALQGIEASSVEVVFRGVDVDMGRLLYPLHSQGKHYFTGGASLSVCTQRRMTWEALVVVTGQGRRYAVPFLFDTEYRSKFKLI